jgi:flagellar hook-basal body complex protein FliE
MTALSTLGPDSKRRTEANFLPISGHGPGRDDAIVRLFRRKQREDRMDVSKIDGMLAQLRAGAALAAGKPVPSATTSTVNAGGGVDFSSVLKNSLDQVSNSQQHAAKLARDFEIGAPGANLTEAMISMQKATISLQYTVQVRNKIVAAYQDIMNMPV